MLFYKSVLKIPAFWMQKYTWGVKSSKGVSEINFKLRLFAQEWTVLPLEWKNSRVGNRTWVYKNKTNAQSVSNYRNVESFG